MSPIDSVFGPYFGENFETRETVYTNFDHFAHPRRGKKACNEDFQQGQAIDRSFSTEHFHPGRPIRPFRQMPGWQSQIPCPEDFPPPPERRNHRFHEENFNPPCPEDYSYSQESLSYRDNQYREEEYSQRNHTYERHEEDYNEERYSEPRPKSPTSKRETKHSTCKTSTSKTRCGTNHNNHHHIAQTERISKDIHNNFDCITSSGEFTIKKGYTLSEVSQAFSNSTNGEISSEKILSKIIELNSIDTPDCIEAGKVIRIPQSVINRMKK